MNNKISKLMRKISLLAVAAVMFTACAQDSFLNNIQESAQPNTIGFTSFSQKGTKGDPSINTNLEYYHNTFVVYGTYKSRNDNSIQYVFGGKATAAGAQAGVVCTYQTPNPDPLLGDWKYTDPRYWNRQADYDFIGYAPSNAPLTYYYSDADKEVGDNSNYFKTSSDYVLTGTNLQATATESTKIKGFTGDGKDLDLMISEKNSEAGDAAHTTPVNLEFRHILSKLNVSFSKAESLQGVEVKITSVKITGLKDQGDYLQTRYATSPAKVSGWVAASSANQATYKLAYTGTQVLNNGDYQDTDANPATPDVFVKGAPFYFIESLVMPQTIPALDEVKLEVEYTITSGGYAEERTYSEDLYSLATGAIRQFFDGYNYTLNFTFDPDPIKFDPTVYTWADQIAIEAVIK